MPKKGEPPRPYCIPIEPFLRIIDEWLEKAMQEWGRAAGTPTDDPIHPTTRLGQMLWPGMNKATADRRLYAFRNEQQYVDFDTADHILCTLELNHLWVTDPELNEIYETVPLPGLDFCRPTSPGAWEQSRADVERLLETLSPREVGQSMGIDGQTVKRHLSKVVAA